MCNSPLKLDYRFRCYHAFQLSLRVQGQVDGAEHLNVHIMTTTVFWDFISVVIMPFHPGNLFFSLMTFTCFALICPSFTTQLCLYSYEKRLIKI